MRETRSQFQPVPDDGPDSFSSTQHLSIGDACEGPSGLDQATHRKPRRQARRGFRFPTPAAVGSEARDTARNVGHKRAGTFLQVL
jgi:hypothetical protein